MHGKSRGLSHRVDYDKSDWLRCPQTQFKVRFTPASSPRLPVRLSLNFQASTAAIGASFPFPLAPATSVVPLYRSSNPGGSPSRGPSFTTRGGDFCRLRCERSSISSRSIDATSRGRTRSCPRLLTILAFGMCGPRAGFPVLCRDTQTEAGAFHQRPAVSGELGLRK
jgi:hypothetical protein